MAKTQEELKQLKVEYETLTNKLKELTDDELRIVTGGKEQANLNEQNKESIINCQFVVNTAK